MTRLGCYYCPEHHRQEDRDYIAKLQPPVIRLLDPDVQQIADMHALAPNAVIACRTWVIDDNGGAAVRNLMADPIKTAIDHANQYRGQLDRWKTEARDRGLTLPSDDHIYFNAANEPNQGGTPDKIAAYTVAFLNHCTELGLRATALCLGVGWPDNSGPDTPVNWAPYAAIVEPIQRGKHWLELHEYFYKDGPQNNWTWWAGRHLQCPFNVPILLGEIGCDNYVDKARWDKEGGTRGWLGNMTADQYAQMVEWHISHSDTRVVAALIFLLDYRNNEWRVFDINPCAGSLLARKDAMVPQATPPKPAGTPPIITNLPAIGTGTQEPMQPTYSGIIEPMVAQAILNVESGSRAFGNDGKPLIRFEAQIFKSYLNNDALWADHFQVDAARPWVNQTWRQSPGDPWKQIHTGRQSDEYAAFELAKSLHADAAYNAISTGAAQIMGFNHSKVGYATAESMYNAFNDPNMQILGFLNFCLSDPNLAQAMRDKDWRVVAALYNGTGAIDSYSKLLREAYESLGG